MHAHATTLSQPRRRSAAPLGVTVRSSPGIQHSPFLPFLSLQHAAHELSVLPLLSAASHHSSLHWPMLPPEPHCPIALPCQLVSTSCPPPAGTHLAFAVPYHRADTVAPGGTYWYLGAAGATTYINNRTGDTYAGHTVHMLRYQLPAGLRCDNCVLQWWYLTGNSCNPPCVPEDPAHPKCDTSMGVCGTSGSNYPEEFWNCADVRILARSGPGSQPSPSPPSQSVASPPPARPPPPLPAGEESVWRWRAVLLVVCVAPQGGCKVALCVAIC